jgi:glutamate 5-kinase
MRSKVIAAEMATAGGGIAFIANAAEPDVVQRIAAGEHIGTKFLPDGKRGSSFKLWLRYAKPSRGRVVVDDGAKAALVDRGASLLPVGVRDVDGLFQAGDAVSVVTDSGDEFAKGISEYASSELSSMIADPARARGALEAIHRDQLVLL